MIKLCRKCGLEADHYESIVTSCKTCWKARVIENRKAKIDYYRDYDRKRGRTEGRKVMFANKQRTKRKAMGADYDRSHIAVARAIESGSLIRPDHCHRCLIQCPAQAHHDDHSKPLEIMWLCPVCHAQRHVELAKIKLQTKES